MHATATPAIRLHLNDDVVIARAQLISGTHIAAENVTVKGMVPPGHKIATRAIAAGAPVGRYNQIIGFASKAIAAGEHVHVNNLATGSFERDYAFGEDMRAVAIATEPATFMGIKRVVDGVARYGTHNYIGLLSTVKCSATACKLIVDHFRGDTLAAYPSVDGAVAKGGTTPLVGVYEYAPAVTQRGFVYMDTPGYDPVSATGQVAGGANIICFTTGRGSAYGCKPSPSLKLSTNNALWRRQEDDIDINCGDIVDDGVSIADKGQEIFKMILKAASAAPSKSERWGYGADEFVPWYIGAVM